VLASARRGVADGIPVLEVLVSTQMGGGPQHVYTLATALRLRGFAPTVAGPRDGAMAETFDAAGVELVDLSTRRLRPDIVPRLARLIARRRIRLVHSHGKGAGVYGRLAARLAGVPALHTFHGIHFERYPRGLRPAYLALERRLAAWTYAVVNVSRAQEAEGLAHGLFGVAQSHVIPNGIDLAALAARALPRAQARARLGVPAASIVVGCAARFDPVKGHALLMDAVGRVAEPGLRLVLLGTGAEERRLRARAGADDVRGRVLFAGEVPDAACLFPAFDLYASASSKEGLPLAVLEAMALGLPVVATDIAGHRELLGDGENVLVAPTADAVARAIERLAVDGQGRRALGAGNRERVQRFDVARMIDATECLYREALGRVPCPGCR
jgi:glycosyltransferase involved in cell wall biosynthesis